MKAKQIIILAAILGLLVLGVVIKNSQNHAELTTEEYQPLDLNFPSESAASILISKPKADKSGAEKIELLKETGVWRIKSFLSARADSEKVSHLLDELSKTKGELRGKDKALFADFGIGDEEAFELVIKDAAAKELIHLRLGVKKADFDSIFLRKEGSDQVFLTQSNLLGQMGLYGDLAKEIPKADYWAALDLNAGDPLNVRKILAKRFSGGQEIVSIDLTREQSAEDPSKKIWKFGRAYSPLTTDAEKIRHFLDSFKSWRAQKIEDPKMKDYGFSSPVWMLTVTSEAGEVTFTAGKMDQDTRLYPIKASNESAVYEMPQYFFQNFDQDDSRFFSENILSADPERIKKITIKTVQKEITLNPKEQKFDGLTNYMNDMKVFRVKRLILDPAESKKVKSPGREWLDIQLDNGKAFTLDLGETVPGDSEKIMDYAALLRGMPQPFVISADAHKQLFENLDRLTPPPSAPSSDKK